ncbi:amidohydrolase family protein [Microbacterium sp.]|uniref:amidohydrolase family protein n=1 Tax=Microbacterium sp. TaxID=51671 RepID=UPI0037C78F29
MSAATPDPVFTPDPDWVPQHPNPSKSAFTPPPGAVDSNVHVFGPGDRFPYAPERRYTPVDASADDLFALHRLLGIERTVIVQGTAHGTDPRALVDALRRAEGRARGVAAVRPDVTDRELDELHEAGVRGIRFTFIARLAAPLPDHAYRALAARAHARGWHVVASLEPADLAGRADLLRELAAPLVIDHLGRPEVSRPAEGPEFERLLQLLRDRPDAWTKIHGAERLSRSGPPDYADLIPFAHRVLEEFPDRVMWASDWPHPNMRDHMPDDGALVDLIPRYAPTADLQRRILVQNPIRLYWPEER